MRIYRERGIYGEGDVYVLETMKDWEEYEEVCKGKDPNFLKWNPNFFSFKKEFEECIGKIWQDKTKIKYTYNGEPVYEEYRVIAIEDNNPQADWYWVVQNVDDDRDFLYINGLLGIKDDIK